ncbi:MAG: UDP-N-acetylmuramate--alanine ligase [Ignavibacteria bacterium]|nr:UDP-N-acetylmuramate--alanine ligase [Ignavibacteria bacterium]
MSEGRRAYFIGIGGTAMAAVAAALARMGWEVSGSDDGVYPPMSDFLASRGIRYHESFAEANLENFGFRISDFGLSAPLSASDSRSASPRPRVSEADSGSATPLIVIGNAVSRGNPEVEAVLRGRFPYTSLAALAGSALIAGSRSLVVAGTHGKTTTASLAAWVLETAGRAPGFLIGGIPENFGEGCRPAAAGGVFVSEGDEYDTAFFDKRSKFVHYRPDILVINNIEFDHADIFLSLDDVRRSFRQVVNLVPGDGLILFNGDDEEARAAAAGAHTPVESFGLGENNDWQAASIVWENGETRFDVLHRSGGGLQCFRYTTPLAGAFNVRNVLGVIAACTALGVSAHDIQAGITTFRSVRRRMEVIAEHGGITVIDDFAHHPTAVRETLAALRQKYPARRIWALFEPRSNTTTRRIFQDDLADAFVDADVAVIGAVNRPGRYAPGESLDTGLLVRELADRGIRAFDIPDVEEMVALVLAETRPGDVVVLMSNGKFGGAQRRIADGVMKLAGGVGSRE